MKNKIIVTGTRGIPNIMGGVETHCEELFPRLASMGYHITIFRRNSYVNHAKETEAGVVDGRWKGVRVVDLTTPRHKAFEAFVHTLKGVIMSRWMQARILHIHAIGPALTIPIAKMLNMNVVFTHHGPDYERDKWGTFAKFVLRIGERLGCRYADHVIVISDVIRESIKQKYGRTKNVHLIYNGVPAPDICHEPEYFSELGIEEGKYILGMCRFVPEKHLHDLVEAYCKLKAERKESTGEELPVKLVLAGDSDFEDDYSVALKKSARDNGVVLTGFVRGTKLHSLLTNAMCYSLPSSHEGLPIALLEAMSYGLPVITSSIPANLEVGLPEDCYHEVGDVEALTDKLKNICSQPLKRVDYDLSKYNWDVIARQVADIYDSILNDKENDKFEIIEHTGREIGDKIYRRDNALYSLYEIGNSLNGYQLHQVVKRANAAIGGTAIIGVHFYEYTGKMEHLKMLVRYADKTNKTFRDLSDSDFETISQIVCEVFIEGNEGNFFQRWKYKKI